MNGWHEDGRPEEVPPYPRGVIDILRAQGEVQSEEGLGAISKLLTPVEDRDGRVVFFLDPDDA